jgi:phosphohistidine phosphatase
MSLTVVLIRHGEAKNKRLGQTDFERELTERGAEALREAFPRALDLVDVTDKTELWVSPATRALQTAQIANETLRIETQRELESMYEQDQEAFLRELSQTDADVVVAVGHIPFMEDVAARLCGTYLGFSTGAAAAVSINESGRGELEWFVQGPRI